MITPTVLGDGPLSASIALIGEAPGSHEIRLRKPFVGMAGQLLMKLMNSCGLARSDVYITNVVKQRPGAPLPKQGPRYKYEVGSYDENDISSWFKAERGKVWTSEGFNTYLNLLSEELSHLSNLAVCIPLGNVSLYALTGLVGIQKRRGSIIESSLIPGLKCIPTIHPSAALREFNFTYFIKNDLQRAVEESKFKEIRLPERELHIRPSYNEILDYLLSCRFCSELGVDIEVVNEEVSCISVSRSPFDCMSIPFNIGLQDYMSPDQELNVWLLLAKLLEDFRIKKVFQNGIFDCSFIYRKYGIRTVNIEDTMIGQGITFPDFPKGLDFITSIYTREPYYKDEGKKWFKFGGDNETFWRYNAKDSAVTMEAFPLILSRAKAQQNEETYHFQRLLIHPLMYMQARGMRVDYEGLSKASAEAEVQIEKLTTELQSICGFAINPNSPAQLKKYFYETKRLNPYYNKGSITTNDDAMKRLARRGIKEAMLIRDIRKLTKLKGTYYDITLSADKRLRSAMNPVGTVSGRLSSSQDIFGEGSNVQNLPEVMLKYILADEGYMIYNVDLSQAENRAVAYIAPEPLMQQAFEQGLDIHSITGGFISGLDRDEVKRQDKEDIKCSLGTGEDTWRFWGKKCNHSLNYDLGYKNFALRFEMPEAQAKILVERFHQLYPGVRQFHAWVRAQLSEDRTLTNCFGRRRVFLGRWGDELFKEAYSFIPQSTIADKINRQGLLYIYFNQHWFRPLELLNQVHDSIVFQIPTSTGFDYHAEALLRIHKNLTKPLTWHQTDFIIPAEFEVGFNLYDTEGIKIDGTTTTRELAKQLHDVYGKLRESRELSAMDRDLSNSSSSSEKGLSSLGNA